MTTPCTICQYENNPADARECEHCGANLLPQGPTTQQIESADTIALPALDAPLTPQPRPNRWALRKLWQPIFTLVSRSAPPLVSAVAALALRSKQRGKGTSSHFVGVIVARPVEQAAPRPPDLRISSAIVGTGVTALFVSALLALVRGRDLTTTLAAAVVVLASLISGCLLAIDIINAFWQQRTSRHETRLRWLLIFSMGIGSVAVVAVPAPTWLLLLLFGLC